jgi:hypothetical protein
MMNASTVATWSRWALAAIALGGCGGGPSSADAGPRVDGGNTPGSDAGTRPGDAGATIDMATWTVSGARSATVSHDGERNYVSCSVVPSSPDFLNLTSAESAAGDPSLLVRVQGYTGPGTYDVTYAPGARADAEVDVQLVGDYSYQFFYDYSTVDFVQVYSTCAITVEETTPGVRIHVLVSCSDLPSDILSMDYDDRNAAGYRPHVSLTASFDCDL